MSELLDAINMAKTAANVNSKQKITKKAAMLSALGFDGEKTASEQPNDMELAKMAAYELAVDSLEKLAYAEQLFEEADYVDAVYVKQASDGSDMEMNTEGEALEAFLQELESEVDE